MQRISGVTIACVIDGRGVEVVFRSPYRWRIYEADRDVTAEFGHARRGDTLPRETPQWQAWHDAVAAGTIVQDVH